ncbi:MAG TPA: PEP-utilizing enzyme [Candidatus Dormibacteraeota bacterium]|nr:PEP-utilizing enzyme [Candidatus Dormibacteraeota bacterium]
MSTMTEKRFPSPFSVPTPEGAEGWESMYAPYILFSDENRQWEESLFWFYDSLHRPEVEVPFDTIVHEAWFMAASANLSREFAVPAANGYASRILNGRLYTTPLPVTEDVIQERAPVFMRRAGHYFEHWAELYEQWAAKMEGVIAEMRAIEIPRLPAREDESMIIEGRGYSTGHKLLTAYNDIVNNVLLTYHYHFELLVLGYGAYLNLHQFCKQAFPGIGDQTVANLAAGADILLFRPDDEVKKLAQRGLELGLADRLRGDGRPEDIVEELRHDPQGSQWVAALDAAKDPWFHYSTGTGLYHHERSWIDDLTVPWAALRGYLDRLERGETIERPTDEILARRDRLADEYLALLPSAEDRAAFQQNVELARTVAPYVENHNFYIEHRHHTHFWNKMRDIGDRMVEGGLLKERDDLFYLNRWDVGQALHDLVVHWSAYDAIPMRTRYWQSMVSRRKEIVEVLRHWNPEPALGPMPPEINEPFMIMLYGLTTERVQAWLDGAEDGAHELHGVPASAGAVEGTARVIFSPDQIPLVEEGEILVCPITAPSWGPVFGRIKATVSDLGGIMCHAAIVSREYGLPAVVGTGRGTKVINTGDRIRVNGDTGVVTVLS